MLCFTFLFPKHRSQFNISADSSVGIGRQGAGADSFQNAAFRCGQPRYGTHLSSCLLASGALLLGLNRSGLHVSAKQVAIFLVYVTCLYCYCLIIYIFWIKMQLFIWYCFGQSELKIAVCTTRIWRWSVRCHQAFSLSSSRLVSNNVNINTLKTKQVKVLFYLILSYVWKSNAFWKHPRLCPFVLLVSLYVWSIGGVLLTGENRSTRRKTCAIATLCTTNLTWIELRWHPGQRLRGLSHGRP
jgi:hypothetical protein